MLGALTLSRVLKKLQLADIAKFLILQTTITTERVSTAAGGGIHIFEIQQKRFCHRQRPTEKILARESNTCGGQSSASSSTDSVSCASSEDLSRIEVKSTKDLSENRRQVVSSNKIIMSSSSEKVQNSTSAQTTNAENDGIIENGNSENKSSKLPSGAPCFNSSLTDIVKFLELVGSLKHIKRTGWVLRDVEDCESISGHMYRMSMMTFLLDGTEGLNRTKCMELALVHDLAESLVGDITPFCGISKEEKKHREIKAMEDICKLIEPRGRRIMELFLEYEDNKSPESKFVKDLDRLDMVLQAFEYEKRDNCVLKHQEFFDSTDGKFDHPFVLKLVNEIHAQRHALAEQKGAVVTNGYTEDRDQNQQNGDVSDLSHKKASTS